MSEPTLNTAVTEAIEWLMKGIPHPVTHGEYNRHMFLEAVVCNGGQGAAIDKEDILRHAVLSDKEFTIIKDEYIAKGIIKEEENLFGVVLYSLQYDNIGGGLDKTKEVC